MKIAIWTVTKGAANLAKSFRMQLSEKEIDVYALVKFEVEDVIAIDDFTSSLEEKFSNYAAHIFIMASGIVVRKLAKLIQRKDVDPAVLLVDEGRHFVISLLSGHLGGANELCYELAERLELIPVVTTSSDITGKIAVDSIAQKLKAELQDLQSAKIVTSLIVNGQEVSLKLPKNVSFEEKGREEAFILLSNRKNIEITRLYPKNLIVGMGCRRGTEYQELLEALEDCFEKHNLDFRSLAKLATVDVKADENGLLELAKHFGLSLEIISREEIKKIETQFEGSDFVEKSIGVRVVSEPVALLASSGQGRFLVQKAKYGGITISIWEEEIRNLEEKKEK